MSNSTHYYELKYAHKDRELVMKFQADIAIDILHDNLREFLLGCGWHPASLDKLFNIEEENNE